MANSSDTALLATPIQGKAVDASVDNMTSAKSGNGTHTNPWISLKR